LYKSKKFVVFNQIPSLSCLTLWFVQRLLQASISLKISAKRWCAWSDVGLSDPGGTFNAVWEKNCEKWLSSHHLTLDNKT